MITGTYHVPLFRARQVCFQGERVCLVQESSRSLPRLRGDSAGMDQTQAYCMALLNQEKSLEELQKHLHKTEVRERARSFVFTFGSRTEVMFASHVF